MVEAGTVFGSRSTGVVVVVVAGKVDVVADGSVEPDDGTWVVVGETAAAGCGGGSSSRVTRYTARPRMNPAATTMITWPALSFTARSS
jgi:hypothetical protein